MMAKRPHVFVVMADQHSSRALGCAGSPWASTPNLDRFAQTSTVMRNAYTAAPVCVPARFAALSGLYPSRSGCVNNGTPLPIQVKTAAHYFSTAGYLTAFLGKMHPVDAQTHGFDWLVDFGHYYDYLGPKTEVFARAMEADNSGKGLPWIDIYQDPDNSWGLVPRRSSLSSSLPAKDHFEPFVVRETLRFARRYKDIASLFVFTSFLRPHAPMAVPASWDSGRIPLPSVLEEEELNPYLRARLVQVLREPGGADFAQEYLRRYAAAVSFVDEQFGALWQGLEELGIAQDSVIVYTSDHGDMLFEHGMLGKVTFYDAAAKVPFIVHLPGQAISQTNDVVFDNTCLLPTLLDAVGVPGPDVDGESLMPWIGRGSARSADGSRGRRTAFSELSLKADRFSELGLRQGRPMCTLRKGGWKLVCYPDGFRQLFDLNSDPDELVNRAGQGWPEETILGNLLEERLEECNRKRMTEGLWEMS